MIDHDITSFVTAERARGHAFRMVGNEYQRVDGLMDAIAHGLVSVAQASTARAYARDYNTFHNFGRFQSGLNYQNRVGNARVEALVLSAGFRMRQATAALTVGQIRLCDAVCGRGERWRMSALAGLPACLDSMARYYGAIIERADISDPETFIPIAAEIMADSAPTEAERIATRIREALQRLEALKAEPAREIRRPGRRPVVVEQTQAERDWGDLLPAKPARGEHGQEQAWLAATGVVRRNRDSRRLGIQARAALKIKARSKGVIRKRVRRKGNS
jgi:hypothetical protein